MTNVSPEIYKVLAMTGFTKFMKVEKKKDEQA
jgi:anti-anti-sigma regulatory factor